MKSTDQAQEFARPGNEIRVFDGAVTVRRALLPPNEWFWELAVDWTPDGPDRWRRLDLNYALDREVLGQIIPESQWGSSDGPA